MKDFNKTKIVSCVMAHDNNDYIKLCLDDLSKYTNEIYVNLNEPTKEVKEIVLSHPKLIKIIQTTNKNGKWNQGLQRDNTIRMLDDIKPDIVLFPDSDEVYPKNFKEQLKKFWEDEEKKTFWFRLFYIWGDKKHFRNDGLWKRIHHVRAYKWQPDISYIPYAGYACPTTFRSLPRETRYNSDTGIRHYGYMSEADRQRKYLRAGPGYNYLRNHEYKAHIDKSKLILELPKEMI